MMDPAELLDLVADRAPKLRSAGVLEVEVGGVYVRLAPAEPEPNSTQPADEDEVPDNVWDDPDLYGRKSGKPVPGAGPARPRGKRRT